MWNGLRKYFLSGLVVFLPITLTIYLFVLTINFADGILGRFIEPYLSSRFGFYFRGLSILVAILIIFIMGFFVANFFGRKIYRALEGMLLQLPFFRQVYPAIKEMAIFLFSQEKLAFKQVVILEYPRKGIYAMGFITNDGTRRMSDIVGQDVCSVLVSTPPSPVTGVVVLVPRKDIIFTDISVEDAVRFIVSGGVLHPGILGQVPDLEEKGFFK